MEIEISQWGNSLGIRIPKAFAEALGLKNKSRAVMKFENNRLIIEAEKPSGYEILKQRGAAYSLEELCKTMIPYGENDENFDVEPLESELWEYEE